MSEVVPAPSPKELIESVVRAFADFPAHVSVQEVSNQLVSFLWLRVDATDIGKVIGKRGEMAKALEDILQTASANLNHRFTFLKISDNLDADLLEAV
jgi:predicted RNA-binding protein YlqC (UPF0109 family)